MRGCPRVSGEVRTAKLISVLPEDLPEKGQNTDRMTEHENQETAAYAAVSFVCYREFGVVQ